MVHRQLDGLPGIHAMHVFGALRELAERDRCDPRTARLERWGAYSDRSTELPTVRRNGNPDPLKERAGTCHARSNAVLSRGRAAMFG